MNKNSWRRKTDAKIISTAPRLRKLVRECEGIAIGLAGFSGSFEKNTRSDAETVTEQVIESMLCQKINDVDPERIFFVSGATNLGVPRIGYAVATKLGCKTVGITAASAISHSIAELDYLTVVGKKFGDESEAFVSVIDELWVIGGGRQSENECTLALASETPVIIVQGIGGIADQLSPENFTGTYVDIDQHVSPNGG